MVHVLLLLPPHVAVMVVVLLVVQSWFLPVLKWIPRFLHQRLRVCLGVRHPMREVELSWVLPNFRFEVLRQVQGRMEEGHAIGQEWDATELPQELELA